MGELKKCWRRTCALYWDTEEATETAGVEEDITPGGPPGTRNETASFSRPQSATILRIPPFAAPPPPRVDIPDRTEPFLQDALQPREGRSSSLPRRMQPRPATTTTATTHSTLYTKSNASGQAENTRRKKSSSTHGPSSPSGKFRPGPHKRSGSFSDALRDNRHPLPLPNSVSKSTQLLMAFPYAGSLVRGNLFPPTPAVVEVIAPSTPVNEPAALAFSIQDYPSSSAAVLRRVGEHLSVPKTAGGPGMRKLFGSFRKALGVKPDSSDPDPSSATKPKRASSAVGPFPVSVARTPSTRSNMSSIEAMEANASKFGMRAARVDLLGAGAVEAFQRAMAEEVTYADSQDLGSGAATSGDCTS